LTNKAKSSVEKNAEKERERYVSELVEEISSDFENRRKERLRLERQWELNMNFLSGNQYCDLNSQGDIADENKYFYWQNRRVFNHVAPIVDTRLAKLACVTPTVSVRPKTDDDKDVEAASLAEKLIESAFKKTDFNEVSKKVTVWSETCGTGFYKILWNPSGGAKIGVHENKDVFEGEVKIIAVSPFEIFPDSLSVENINDCESIIHAKAMTVSAVKEKYGVDLVGESISVHNLNKHNSLPLMDGEKDLLHDAVVVIERFEKPTSKFPNGRMITVAGDKLLYVGDMPYVNGENGERTYPFVKQDAMPVAGSFFGTGVVERLIPVQRAYNAVKNRKHEFLNRLSMGVMTVEDGSIDVDDLAEDGLSPGKVLVYRQGSKAPEIMSDMTMPSEFNEEEDKLLNEFVIVSGVSDVSSSAKNASVSSGSALEILVEQDNARMVMPAEIIRKCRLEVARQIIKLYAQFSAGIRAIKYQDDFNKTRIVYADKRVAESDDVYLESENELLYTHAQKNNMIFKLYESGLLHDEDGKIRSSVKEKVLSLLGYKELDYGRGIARLQEEKAQSENERLRRGTVSVDVLDDDAIHVAEHTRFVLSEYGDLTEEQKQNYYAHVSAHKEKGALIDKTQKNEIQD
jgi:hypothetical protein